MFSRQVRSCLGQSEKYLNVSLFFGLVPCWVCVCLWFSKSGSSFVSCLLYFRVRPLLCSFASGQVIRTCRIESLLCGGWLGYLRICVVFKLNKLLSENYIFVWTSEWRKVREAFIHASINILDCELSNDGTWWPLVASKGLVR